MPDEERRSNGEMPAPRRKLSTRRLAAATLASVCGVAAGGAGAAYAMAWNVSGSDNFDPGGTCKEPAWVAATGTEYVQGMLTHILSSGHCSNATRGRNTAKVRAWITNEATGHISAADSDSIGSATASLSFISRESLKGYVKLRSSNNYGFYMGSAHGIWGDR